MVQKRDIPATTITANGETITNSGIQDGMTSTMMTGPGSGLDTVIIGGDTYVESGPTASLTPLDSISGMTASTNIDVTNTAATASTSPTGESSSTSDSGAQITQGPLLAAGVAGLAYLVL